MLRTVWIRSAYQRGRRTLKYTSLSGTNKDVYKRQFQQEKPSGPRLQPPHQRDRRDHIRVDFAADRNGRIPLRQFYDCITAWCYHIYRPPFENDLGIGARKKAFALTMPSCIMGQKPKLLRCHPNWRKNARSTARQHAPSPGNGGMPVSHTLRRAGFGAALTSPFGNGLRCHPRTNGRLSGSAVSLLLTLALRFCLVLVHSICLSLIHI